MKSYFVYILECIDSTFYVGITSNLMERLQSHNSGLYPNSYTFSRRPVKIGFFEEYTDPDIAIDFEKKIKGWSRAKKKALIRKNWRRIQDLAQCQNDTSSFNYSLKTVPFDKVYAERRRSTQGDNLKK
ncbi:MAG: GIY-YIG nuclease family protein [Flavobacteriales bacterium]